jgi:hypothetical protein
MRDERENSKFARIKGRKQKDFGMRESERRRELGDWGEQKALDLLKRDSGFKCARDVNEQTHNHPFGDIYAERGYERFLIGVKTRNMYQVNGELNCDYNIRRKGADVHSVAQRYKADLGWVAIQVIPEQQTFNAYFGTITQIDRRFSIPMRPPTRDNSICPSGTER